MEVLNIDYLVVGISTLYMTVELRVKGSFDIRLPYISHKICGKKVTLLAEDFLVAFLYFVYLVLDAIIMIMLKMFMRNESSLPGYIYYSQQLPLMKLDRGCCLTIT